MSGRFTADDDRLARSLAWHAKVTNELQTRILEAREYVSRHTGDRQLLGILAGKATDEIPPTAPDPYMLDFGGDS